MLQQTGGTREFADNDFGREVGCDLPSRGENRDSNREIVGGSFFAQVRGSEINRYTSDGKLQARILGRSRSPARL